MPRLGPIGIWELLIIVFVLLLFFGSRRLPEMARGIAESIGEFRKGIRDSGEEGKAAADEGDDDDVDEPAEGPQKEPQEGSASKVIPVRESES